MFMTSITGTGKGKGKKRGEKRGGEQRSEEREVEKTGEKKEEPKSALTDATEIRFCEEHVFLSEQISASQEILDNGN